MNYFVAVSLPPGLQKSLNSLLPENPGWKKVLPKQIHLTLRFIGSMSEPEVSKLTSELKKVEFRPFKLSLGEIGFFPKDESPRVIWMGIKEPEELNRLQKSVDDIVTEVTGKSSEYRFRPHITLARIKKSDISRQMILKKIKSLVMDQSFEVKRFHLIKSERDHRGPAYHNIQHYDALRSQ